MLTALVHTLVFFTIKTSYDGDVLARLPFYPWGMIQSLSHRNLPGTDTRECGIVLLYMLCSMCLKPNIQKALGHDPPKTAIPANAHRWAERLSGVSSTS